MTVATEARVAQVLSEVLEVPVQDVTRNKLLADDLGADSLDFIKLWLTLEIEFDLGLEGGEVDSCTHVHHVYELIDRHTAV